MNAHAVIGSVLRLVDLAGKILSNQEAVLGIVVGVGEVDCLIALFCVVESCDGNVDFPFLDSRDQAVERHVDDLHFDPHAFTDLLHEIDIEPDHLTRFVYVLEWGVVRRSASDDLASLLDGLQLVCRFF